MAQNSKSADCGAGRADNSSLHACREVCPHRYCITAAAPFENNLS
jgi:hypothetical protein